VIEASAWFLLISPPKITDFSMRVQLSVALLRSCGTPAAFYVVCSQTESNRSDAYGKEAKKADRTRAEKAKKAKSDWDGLRRAHGVAQSS
jgi:hypothetical protein